MVMTWETELFWCWAVATAPDSISREKRMIFKVIFVFIESEV